MDLDNRTDPIEIIARVGEDDGKRRALEVWCYKTSKAGWSVTVESSSTDEPGAECAVVDVEGLRYRANKVIARVAAAAFGGVARVVGYSDANDEASIGILRCVDRPWEGVTSFATVGLSDSPLPGSVSPSLGTEMVGGCDSRVTVFADVLATAAFCVINSGWRCEPGVVFSSVVAAHLPDTTVPHLLFVPPFLWEADLRSRVVEGKTVAWLLAVPISDSERDFAQQHGADALEDEFERAQIDVFDLWRSPVVRHSPRSPAG